MEQGIRLSFVKTSEFRGGFEHPKPPPRYATLWGRCAIISNADALKNAVHYDVMITITVL
jgi:hypothetical protein